jgi:hypothetical protein
MSSVRRGCRRLAQEGRGLAAEVVARRREPVGVAAEELRKKGILFVLPPTRGPTNGPLTASMLESL